MELHGVSRYIEILANKLKGYLNKMQWLADVAHGKINICFTCKFGTQFWGLANKLKGYLNKMLWLADVAHRKINNWFTSKFGTQYGISVLGISQ